MYGRFNLSNSVGEESAFNAGDPSLIPGSGRSDGEGKGQPLQYSWVSLVAQLAKNLPAMWKTWVQSLGWEDPMKQGKATHSSILVWRIRTQLSNFHSSQLINVILYITLKESNNVIISIDVEKSVEEIQQLLQKITKKKRN